MVEKQDIYHWEHRLELENQRLEQSNVSKQDKDLIKKFREECFAKGLSVSRAITYMQNLRLFKEKYLKRDFKDCTVDDMKSCFAIIERAKLSEWTKTGYKIAAKVFFRWLYKMEDGYPEVVKWIKTTPKGVNEKTDEDMLTEDDVLKLIEAAGNIRDKALISFLWDSGCRVGEVLSLRIKDIGTKEGDTYANVVGKTGKRRVELTMSIPYVSNWVNNHPLKNDKESSLWLGLGTRNKDKGISYSTIGAMLWKLSKKANIGKPINAHNWRHSRATFYASRVNEAVMNAHFGWKQGSRMSGVYVHLSGRDTSAAIKKANNQEVEEEEFISKLRPKRCWRCKKDNGIDALFCNSCGADLDAERRRMERMALISDGKGIPKEVDMENKEQIKELLVRIKDMEGKLRNFL